MSVSCPSFGCGEDLGNLFQLATFDNVMKYILHIRLLLKQETDKDPSVTRRTTSKVERGGSRDLFLATFNQLLDPLFVSNLLATLGKEILCRSVPTSHQPVVRMMVKLENIPEYCDGLKDSSNSNSVASLTNPTKRPPFPDYNREEETEVLTVFLIGRLED
ncbi:unnamed protein product [Lepeophtheirus salmonis]|uniref:(salmon louse) hypothetical protein n=1 Tax=Lepeophtheirus salmonis TaxID=72036 RepID=A0A7R8CNC8_LEPSM|nr:unnamed protein product [Lepeophtheirus salmonis]CAF2874199.1 unnamed protein product [Lepeophtheirus salmonis]